ncbi:hypothetical protein WDU94_011671 [Cyamophila willieti]
MMSSESRSKSTSCSGSEEVYQDVHGCCNNQHNICTGCSQNVNVAQLAQQKNSNCYEQTVKYLLNQLARGDTDVLKRNPEELSEQEPISHYYHGGYHVQRLGEFLNQRRYFILRKLGWDELSTQWLARDVEKKTYVMVNIYKSSEMHTAYAYNVINALTQIQEHPSDKIMKLLDHFKVTGINGTHVCTVTDIIAECLCNYMIRQKFQPAPLSTAKAIIYQILEGLRDLHVNNKLVHTSIKPESIFFKADHVYIMSMVYETYTAFKKCILPTSFTCNLPDRLVHFRTNIADVYPHIQTKMLLLDRELELLVNGEETSLIKRRKEEMSDELGVNTLQEGNSSFRFPDSTNSLMKRLSRYIKSKINLQQSTTQQHTKLPLKNAKSESCSTSLSSNASKYKSTNTTNFRSPQSTSSNSSIMSQITISDQSDFENEKQCCKEENNLPIPQHEVCCMTQDDQLLLTHISKSKIPCGCTCQASKESTNEESGEDDRKCEHDSNLEKNINDLKNTQVVDNGRASCEPTDTQIDEVKKENENNTENICSQDTDIPLRTDDLTTTDQGADLRDKEIELNMAKAHVDETKYTIEKKTDSLDEIKTSPEQSDNEQEIESHNASASCESKRTDDCKCHHCQGHAQSSHETNKGSSQEDSSYSTSTSTQESYSEFLLSYCKHNTLCTNYTKYLKRITTFAHWQEKKGKEEDFQIVITDVENARPENDETIEKEDIHRQYKAIELIYMKEFDVKIDIWSVACLTFELVTGDYLFNPFETKYYTIDEHQILKIIQLMSEIPPNIMENERCIRNIKALLERDQQVLTSMTAKENFYRILSKSYKIPKDDAKQLVRFLIPMLQLIASKRATAEECLQSEWFTRKNCVKCPCLT